MVRLTSTRAHVREIAAAALQRGENPTQAMIKRQILELYGTTANPNLVKEELNRFMSEVSTSSLSRYTLPDLPVELAEGLATLWETACQKAEAQVAIQVAAVTEREHQADIAIQDAQARLAEEQQHRL